MRQWAYLAAAILAAANAFGQDLLIPLGGLKTGRDMPPHVIRAQHVAVDPPTLAALAPDAPKSTQQSFLALTLLDDITLDVKAYALEGIDRDRFIWRGEALDWPGAEVVLSVVGDSVAGHVSLPGAYPVEIRPGPDGVHQVRELNGDAAPSCGAGENHAVRLPGGGRKTGKGASPQVDITVLYTPAVRQSLGGFQEADALAQLAITQANEAYERSEVIHRLRLVRSAEVNYTESGDLGLDLDRLTRKNDGFMDQIHNLRNADSSDLVALLVNEGDSAGLGWIMQNASTDFEDFGFSVTDVEFAASFYVLAHEVGHNMGCAHERGPQTTPGAFPYAHGRVTENWRTIMAAVASNETIPHFSNPNVLFMGAPTGLGVTQPESAFNARTLNDTSSTVSLFRDQNFTVSPPNRDVGRGTGVVFFDVNFVGGGELTWTAEILSGASWLGFATTPRGSGAGRVGVSVNANPNDFARLGSIRITATGAVFADVIVTVTQAPSCDPPPAGQNVQASDGAFTDRIRITWEQVAEADQYRVYRSLVDNPETASPITPWLVNITAYDDTTVQGETMPLPGCPQITRPAPEYHYWVRSRNVCGESAFGAPDAGTLGTARKGNGQRAARMPIGEAVGLMLILGIAMAAARLSGRLARRV